jgi:hypothetical protein
MSFSVCRDNLLGNVNRRASSDDYLKDQEQEVQDWGD